MRPFVDLTHVVVDASVIVDFMFHPRETAAFATALGRKDVDIHVPGLCDIEVAAGLRRALLRKHITPRRAQSIVEDFCDLPLERYEHELLLPRVLELHRNFSVYDATYVALAEALGASLLTADASFALATRTHTDVLVIEAA